MRDVAELVDGYRRFLTSRFPQEAALYEELTEKGQSPKTMVIACSDSRVDPAAIFSTGPGQLFVVRNVANLVPRFDPHGDNHGIGAALEFAVTGLKVETILVMGHARCGGVRALLEGAPDDTSKQSLIDRWMSHLNAARSEVLRAAADETVEVQARALEHVAVRHSIQNLKTFPFIKERVDEGGLRLRGAHFDIADGTLMALDHKSGTYAAVD